MCGIAGFLGPGRPADQFDGVLRSMAGSMDLRGPDAQDTWHDPVAGIGLAHARLSIIDLSDSGLQPMQSADGSMVIVFNGEIYNFHELRKRLEDAGQAPENGWRGGSDTEVLLAAIRAWGVHEAVNRAVGMFAFAVWDAGARRLTLARDRMGIKPLYYGFSGRDFVFGSTLAPLAKHPDFSPAIDRDAIALYLQTLYVPCPYSIYEGIAKLPPGNILTVGMDDVESRSLPRPETWWSVNWALERGLDNPFAGDEHEAGEELQRLLEDSIRLRLISDVPLGAFLSGGVDSSTVVALMQKLSGSPVKTFTIGAESREYDEAANARAVAEHLGTQHTALVGRPRDAMEIVPLVPKMCDEPFADSSIIPTYMVSKLARENVTVSLSGDGGDELFAGYNRYLLAPSIWKRISALPLAVRRRISRLIDPGLMVPATALVRMADKLLPSERRQLLIADKTLKVVQAMRARDRAEFHHMLASYWADPLGMVIGAEAAQTRFTDKSMQPDCRDFVHWMQTQDQATYLPDDILTKVDRASMAVSLEARVPVIDHRIVEFSHTLPLQMKIGSGSGKRLLRKILYKHVPSALIERPKQGFSLPIDEWLRGPLKTWAEELLDEGRLKREGYLRPEPVKQAWKEHLSGRKNMPYHLWAVLMFQAWLDEVS